MIFSQRSIFVKKKFFLAGFGAGKGGSGFGFREAGFADGFRDNSDLRNSDGNPDLRKKPNPAASAERAEFRRESRIPNPESRIPNPDILL